MNWLFCLSFAFGFISGPVLNIIAEFQPTLLAQAVGYTAIMFGSFTAIAMFSKRRSYLFLGGIISTTLSCLFWYSLFGWFFSSFRMDHLTYLMISLLVSCMYVIFDTQLMIERAENHNDRDVPKNTMILFFDLIDLFFTILQVLQKLEENKGRKRDEDRD